MVAITDPEQTLAQPARCLAARDPTTFPSFPPVLNVWFDPSDALGITVKEDSNELTRVHRGGQADRAGVLAGMLVVSVGGKWTDGTHKATVEAITRERMAASASCVTDRRAFTIGFQVTRLPLKQKERRRWAGPTTLVAAGAILWAMMWMAHTVHQTQKQVQHVQISLKETQAAAALAMRDKEAAQAAAALAAQRLLVVDAELWVTQAALREQEQALVEAAPPARVGACAHAPARMSMHICFNVSDFQLEVG